MQAAEDVAKAKAALASEESSCIASGQQSEHLVMLAAYNGWQACFSTNQGGSRLARNFCKQNLLSHQTLQMLQDIRSQYAALLADIRWGSEPLATMPAMR